jgi:hypothetical protein
MHHDDEKIVDQVSIAALAHELYRARGGEPGHELEDWLRAESELHRIVTRITETVSSPAPASDSAPRSTTAKPRKTATRRLEKR